MPEAVAARTATPATVADLPWYPTLVALAFVLEPYATFDLEPASGVRVVLVTAALALAITIVAVGVIGRDRGGAIACLATMGLIAGTTPSRALLFVLPAVVIVIEKLLVERGPIRLLLPWPRITRGLNVVGIAFLAVQLTLGVAVKVRAPTLPLPAAWTGSPRPAGASPDIFVILADAHPRGDVFRTAYGGDPTVLERALEAADFDEATDSHANHVFTRYSLSVLLNGRPLSELGQDMSAAPDEQLASAALRGTASVALLRSSGYETVLVNSGYEHVRLHQVDRDIDVGPRNELEKAYLTDTLGGQLLERATGGDVSPQRTRVLGELDALEDLAEEPPGAPMFVFTHLPAPHEPFVFTADCSPRGVDSYTTGSGGRRGRAGNEVAVAVARDQATCVDRLLVEAVRRIVTARPHAVVLVMSDHGPDERLDWTAPDEPGLSDRFANLFWARTPGRPGLFPDDITLVNVLPILFNSYLGSDLPLHPNDLWFGPAPGNDQFVRYTRPAL